MIVNDNVLVMLLVEAYFQTFTSRSIADAGSSTGAILSFSLKSREAVDDMLRRAPSAGGTPSEEAQDYGFTYTHGFQDPDGHQWEVFWMDPAGPPKDAPP